MAYQSPSTAFSGSNWSPMGLFGSAFKQATGQTSIMGSPAVSPASKVAPPVNTISTSQTQPSWQSTLQKIVPSATPVNTGSKGLLAPGQTTTQGNQASPQPVAPVAPTAPSTPAAPVQPTGVSSYQQGLNADATASANTQALNNASANNYQTQPASSSLGVYGQSTQNLSNTQPTTGTTNAITASQGIANGNPQNQQGQNYANNINSSQGLLGQFAQNQTPAVTQAENAYSKFVGTTDPNAAASQAALASPESIALGRSQQLGDRLASTAQGLGSAYQAAVQGEAQQINSAQQQGNQAIQGQQNQLTGANQAGNLSNTAQSNQIGAQSTVAGLPYGIPATSGANGGNLDPQTYASNLAQQVINGTMSLQDAQSSMGYAGSAGSAFLQQAITKSNPNFNFNQANTNSQVQGNLPPAASQASSMLTNLQNTLASAPWYDQTGLPFVNAMGKLLSTVGIGTAGTQAVNSALVDARSAMANALGAANNSTPSTYDGYVQTLLPNDITPSQLQSAISQFNTQIQGKLAAYKSPGNTNFTNNPGSSSSSNTSTQNISGTNFTKVNGQWVAS